MPIARKRAAPSGIRLTAADAAIVKGMLARGDRQHDIASWFGVNGGRIANVATGDSFPNVPAAPVSDLPAPGPYLSGKAAHAAVAALAEATAALSQARQAIQRRI
jgi:hypothetical protein